ncbi:MAG: recombinase family protein [Planctomycetota bacterium]
MKAYSYVRFSSPEQRKGFSFDRQSEGSIRLCQRHGWSLDDSVRLHDLGRSAFHGHQIVLKAFVKAIEAGEVETPSVLIIEKLDRLSREEIDDAYNLWRTILRHGVMIATVQPERIYDKSSLNKITDIMEALLHFMVAHEESQKKSDRAIDNWQRKRKNQETTGKPIAGKRPAWIDKNFEVIEDKAETIRLIFKMSIDGHGAKSILRHLNTNKIPNIAIGYCKRSKVSWNQRYVESLLTDKKTFGENQIFKGSIRNRIPQGPPVPNYFPAVITEKTFFSAQAARGSRLKQRGPNGKGIANIFQGLLVDGDGNSFTLQNASDSDRKNGIVRRLATNGKSVPVCLFETYFLKALREMDTAMLEPTENPLPSLEAKLLDLDGRIDDITETLKTRRFASGLALMAELDEQRDAVRVAIDAAKSATSSAIDPQTIVRTVDLLDKAKDKEPLRRKIKSLMRQIVSKITLRIEDVGGNRLHKKWHVAINFHQGKKTTFLTVETYKGEVKGHRALQFASEGKDHHPGSRKPLSRKAAV